MKKTTNFVASFWRDESGVSSVEYALLMALVVGGIAVAAFVLGDSVAGELNGATDCVGDQICG